MKKETNNLTANDYIDILKQLKKSKKVLTDKKETYQRARIPEFSISKLDRAITNIDIQILDIHKKIILKSVVLLLW